MSTSRSTGNGCVRVTASTHDGLCNVAPRSGKLRRLRRYAKFTQSIVSVCIPKCGTSSKVCNSTFAITVPFVHNAAVSESKPQVRIKCDCLIAICKSACKACLPDPFRTAIAVSDCLILLACLGIIDHTGARCNISIRCLSGRWAGTCCTVILRSLSRSAHARGAGITWRIVHSNYARVIAANVLIREVVAAACWITALPSKTVDPTPALWPIRWLSHATKAAGVAFRTLWTSASAAWRVARRNTSRASVLPSRSALSRAGFRQQHQRDQPDQRNKC